MAWLFDKDMPVWLSLLLVIVGAGGTYLVIPHINFLLEQEKIRTAYIIDNLKNTNNETSLLYNNIRKFKNGIEGKENIDLIYSNLEDQITNLQWRAIEYDVIFGDQNTHGIVTKYKNDLTALSRELSKKREIDFSRMYCLTKNFVYSSHRVLRLVAERADLTIGAQPTFIIPDSINCLEVDSTSR
ncbi:hypothetical protein ACFSKO_07400 [Kiloniella antarctica]|uniref:Uncharacterized protein n=2 Tax=Kiloniella antarctica TaxID=1550907 RepID=A0ABW5BIL5_9PROT